MLYQLFWLFLAFSFLGWCLEVAATAVRLGQYRDRGVLHGPLRRTGWPIVCLPNRLSIEWAAGADVDALSGTGGLS